MGGGGHGGVSTQRGGDEGTQFVESEHENGIGWEEFEGRKLKRRGRGEGDRNLRKR